MDKIDHMENFRDIRRVSLEDSFFEQFNMQIGNSIKARYFRPGRLMSFLGRLVQSAAYFLEMLL